MTMEIGIWKIFYGYLLTGEKWDQTQFDWLNKGFGIQKYSSLHLILAIPRHVCSDFSFLMVVLMSDLFNLTHIDGLVQNCIISIANALGILQSYT